MKVLPIQGISELLHKVSRERPVAGERPRAAIQNLNNAEMSDTWIEATVTGPGTIEYWWKVADYIFSLQINGAETTRILWNVD